MDSNVKYAIEWEILLQIIYNLTNVNINNQIWMHVFPFIKIINTTCMIQDGYNFLNDSLRSPNYSNNEAL